MMTSSKRLILICTIGAVAGVMVTLISPVNSRLYRLALIGCVSGAWLGCLLIGWRSKLARIGLGVLPVLLAVPFALPGCQIDSGELREAYARRLTQLEGTKYFWGGETRYGIDCSGLPRRAYRDALLDYGIRHGNGRAFRGWLEQWWFDTSAQALGEGYRGFTAPIGLEGTVREMDYQLLQPGDLAVTAGGAHVIVYAGDGRWIQADPSIGKVKTLNGRTDANGWFTTKVTVHRWALLAP